MARKGTWALLAVAALATAAGIYWGNRPEASADRAAAQLVGLTLPDQQGRPVRLDQWRDRVLVLNFWATWCEPCRVEVPALIRVQSKFGSNVVQIVGISVDSADKVRQFAKDYGINYPLVIAPLEIIDISRQLGNRAAGLPFTVILDRRGNIVRTYLGAISEAALEKAVMESSS